MKWHNWCLRQVLASACLAVRTIVIVFLFVPVAEQALAQDATPLDRAVAELSQSGTPSELQNGVRDEPGMVRSFLDSWPLFHNTYLSGWLIAATLAIIGVLVVARDQVFIGAAVAQASMLGIAIGLALVSSTVLESWRWLRSDDGLSALAVAFSVLAALATARSPQSGRESPEAVTGWVFLISASLSILIVARSPHGLEEIHRLVSSSIIGSTATDVVIFGVLAGLSATLCVLFGRHLLLFALDPEMAAAVGMRTRLWGLGFCVWLGLVVGLSIRAAGMLYTFGCLVLPALVAKNVCHEVRPMFAVAPIVAVTTGVGGFMLANHADLPPAQTTVALLCALVVLTWGLRAGHRIVLERQKA